MFVKALLEFQPILICDQAEDWQSEKCDVPLAEALPVRYVCAMLDEACNWLKTSAKGEMATTKNIFIDVHVINYSPATLASYAYG